TMISRSIYKMECWFVHSYDAFCRLFEAATLAGMEEITSVEQLKDAAKRIHDQGVPNVLAKAGPSLGTCSRCYRGCPQNWE
ncbi:MAG: hypothetical protein ACFN4Q_03385, partial [Rothia dentocariosa]